MLPHHRMLIIQKSKCVETKREDIRSNDSTEQKKEPSYQAFGQTSFIETFEHILVLNETENDHYFIQRRIDIRIVHAFVGLPQQDVTVGGQKFGTEICTLRLSSHRIFVDEMCTCLLEGCLETDLFFKLLSHNTIVLVVHIENGSHVLLWILQRATTEAIAKVSFLLKFK